MVIKRWLQFLIYAINRSSPKHQKAQKFLQEKKEELVIAQQNIFEYFETITVYNHF